MLSDRRQRVLAALVEEYVAHAMPVGSRTLTERYGLGVSSATVRNDLSALEDAGYITQPHTSAGRIPTDAGYRAFVDDLLSSDLVREESPHEDLVAELRASANELDALMERTSAALTRLTDCLSVVVAPSLVTGRLRQVSLISLSNYRALIVAVVDDGQVINRHLSFPEEVLPDELARIQNILNNVFAGKASSEIRDLLDAQSIELLRDPLGAYVLDELVLCLHDRGAHKSHRVGMSSLLRQPEFKNSQSLLPIMQVLEDDTVLLHILDDAAIDDSPYMVRIGRENKTADLNGVSVVARQFGRGEAAGVVAVIGPTRMDYSKVIRALSAAHNALRDS